MKGIFVCIMVVVASAFTSCINDKKSCQCTGVAEEVTAVTVEGNEDCASASYTTVVDGVTVSIDCE